MPKNRVFDENLADYEEWFVVNEWVYRSELKALSRVVPGSGQNIEIGIGSGLFAKPLGIKEGVDPSRKMREKARERGLEVIDAVAEDLPYPDSSRDLALLVTTICFVDDITKTFSEAHRVLKQGGHIVIGFVDKNSQVGRTYLKHQHESVFYRDAIFFGTDEVYELLREAGFRVVETWQTIFGALNEVREIQKVVPGHGKGSFVVINAIKE